MMPGATTIPSWKERGFGRIESRGFSRFSSTTAKEGLKSGT